MVFPIILTKLCEYCQTSLTTNHASITYRLHLIHFYIKSLDSTDYSNMFGLKCPGLSSNKCIYLLAYI